MSKDVPLSEKAFWIDAGKCVGHSYNPKSERAKRRIKESFRQRKRFYYKDVKEAVENCLKDIDNPAHEINCSFDVIKRIFKNRFGEFK